MKLQSNAKHNVEARRSNLKRTIVTTTTKHPTFNHTKSSILLIRTGQTHGSRAYTNVFDLLHSQRKTVDCDSSPSKRQNETQLMNLA